MSFKLHRDVLDSLDPAKFEPHGDRYIVEEAEIGEEKTVGDQVLFVPHGIGHLDKQTGRFEEAKTFEEANGYFIGRVVAKGNGHRLERDEVVPMPFQIGDVLKIERFTGRKFTHKGAKYRLVNQVDCLAKITELSPEEPARISAVA